MDSKTRQKETITDGIEWIVKQGKKETITDGIEWIVKQGKKKQLLMVSSE